MIGRRPERLHLLTMSPGTLLGRLSVTRERWVGLLVVAMTISVSLMMMGRLSFN